MTSSDVRWSCSAHLDLLGFSNHLMVANWDIRTQTGEQAIDRLSSFEEALNLFEREMIDYPELYPSTLHYIRFNDALFLGIDAEHLAPTTLSGGYSIDQLKKMHPQRGKPVFEGTPAESGGDVAKFLGLVARIHKYINAHEANKSFPGCRTVVASGQRKCFRDRKDVDDFFSANLSISTAFEAEKKGSSAGLKGNHLYVEDDVAMAISYCKPCYAIVGFSKFFHSDSPLIDPYQYKQLPEGTSVLPHDSWTIPGPITLDIMKKRLTFRHLNPTVLTNLQLFKDYQQVATMNGQVEREISNSLSSSTPTLEEVNNSSVPFVKIDSKKQTSTKYPFLFLEFSLDNDYSNFFGQE